MTVKRPLEDDSDIENMAMANCLMLLTRVGNSDLTSEPDRLFRCKTCNKPFQSFQALGGHCASHKRLKVSDGRSPMKPKTHECSVCGQEFALGQALGGHMRRHRDETTGKSVHTAVKKESGTMGLCLDLGLAPYDVDLKLWPIVS
ncbi:putative transcription factor C2H2 family [Helianthus annuus]|uniref:Putative zinc finger, C2H2-like protein n=1 Tax=Helianthus annuus TaxID=4232 RepID=A0A251TN00_HELAN|nr:zinc finger protein ZAT12 [Helianthus annuus]KAF5782107.1 putative transcription factor C2H2 family [Helianthus annuus]KAJ0501636.1 putative transcription factor C2H2 family [Helianthus annuus]KAJ0509486.1 putative transcription factor C2H2 family [Helianthus annuus]KAJ0517542.1 putative transcription factor C2H2 family [Helianthus annuus]KAJ0685552.1 putative transcription factor C2H2 family [Helianthus annuus]